MSRHLNPEISFNPHLSEKVHCDDVIVPQGLKSRLTDYKAASYMVVCQLAVKVAMEASLVDVLAVHVSKSLLKEPVLAKEAVACLIVLLQNQREGAVGPR